MTLLKLFGERSLTVVAASYSSREAAESATSTMLKETPALEGKVAIIKPGDPMVDRKIEPENKGIWRTLIRSHALLGVAGALAGVLVALVAIALPWQAAALSPGYTALFGGMLGAFLGLICAGLLTLRPDQAYVIRKVHGFSGSGRWSVIARPLNEACSKAAYASMVHSGSGAVRSL